MILLASVPVEGLLKTNSAPHASSQFVISNNLAWGMGSSRVCEVNKPNFMQIKFIVRISKSTLIMCGIN